MKKLWISAALLMTAGLFIAGVGIAMGANDGGLYIDRKGIHLNSSEFELFKNTDLDTVKELTLNMSSTDIEIRTADFFGYEIFARDPENYIVSFTDGRLEIEQRRVFNIMVFNFSMKNEYVIVYVPKGAVLEIGNIKSSSGNTVVDSVSFETLNLRNTSGNATVKNVEAAYVTLKLTSGGIKVNGMKTGSFDATLSSGNLTVSELEASSLHCNLTSGNCKISGKLNGDATLKLTSGNVVLDLKGKEQDFNRVIKVNSGRVRINGSRESAGNVNFNAEHTLDIKATSGNVDVGFNN